MPATLLGHLIWLKQTIYFLPGDHICFLVCPQLLMPQSCPDDMDFSDEGSPEPPPPPRKSRDDVDPTNILSKRTRPPNNRPQTEKQKTNGL